MKKTTSWMPLEVDYVLIEFGYIQYVLTSFYGLALSSKYIKFIIDPSQEDWMAFSNQLCFSLTYTFLIISASISLAWQSILHHTFSFLGFYQRFLLLCLLLIPSLGVLIEYNVVCKQQL